MLVNIYRKDISQRRKNENLKAIELYYKNKKNKKITDSIYQKQRSCFRLNLVYKFYQKIEHRVCLKVHREKYWIRSNYGYKVFKRDPIGTNMERFRKINMYGDNKFIYYDGRLWMNHQGGYFTNFFDDYRKAIIFLGAWIDYKKLFYISEFLHTDVANYTKVLYLKPINTAGIFIII